MTQSICEPDAARVFRLFCAALDAGESVALLDHAWPAGLRAAASDLLARAGADGRLAGGDLVLFTSGSTGRPRGVVRGVASWSAGLDPLTSLLGLTTSDTVWLPGPLTSSLYLYGAWHARAVGAQVLLVGDDPVASTVLHAVPTVLARLVAQGGAGLPRLHTVVVAGDRLDPRVREAARGLGWRVVEYYGAAELSFVAWRDDDGPLRPFPGARVAVRGGRLWVASPYLARGYLDPADDGPLRRSGMWASVGDLAAGVPADGEDLPGVRVLGRGDAAVTTGGHTVVAEEVEAVLAAVDGVQQALVLGTSDARLGEVVVAMVVPTPGADLTRRDLDTAVRVLPAPARPRRWLLARRLPLTAAGKPDRDRARRAVASGGSDGEDLGLWPLR